MNKTAVMVLPTVLALAGHPNVDDAYRQMLLTTVETLPRQRGHACSPWAGSDLARYREHRGSGAVSDETVRRHLHARG
jgi:hypothetical protein